MKTLFLVAIASVFSLFLLAGNGGGRPDAIPPVSAQRPLTQPKKTMRPFSSDQELLSYLKQLAERQSRRPQAGLAASVEITDSSSKRKTEAAGGGGKDESVTNVQHDGVDEGGIVKLHGDHLVVLRRGRLFTVAIGDDALRPISIADAFGPEINPRSTWYDEMLISDDTIAIIGYSYERGGTEVGLFQIDSRGHLKYRSTYQLRSNDYYSSRNYASRLIGNKLIFYTPFYFYPGAAEPFQSFPAVRKWHKRAKDNEFQRIVPATRVYRPEGSPNGGYGTALHTVTVCDLANGGFACEATSVVGPAGRVFYVSPESVYVWMSDWWRQDDQTQSQSLLYRLPLDGSAPSALQVSGSPVDQFSFLESADGQLNVLVRAGAAGDGMWAAEVTAGDVALMRVPLASFSDGNEPVPASSYRKLPTPVGFTFQNRFVSDYLLYGTGTGWGDSQDTRHSSVYAVRWAGGEARELALAHGVDRIEVMGQDAVVVGTDGKDLHFTAVRLGESPEIASRYSRKGASQGELRSHGFFYRAEGADSGMLGLPISLPGRPGYRHLFETSAAILFLRNDSLQFIRIGELGARQDRAVDDNCRASCVDWYGNARPLFVRGRVFALLGYELVEGTLKDGRMRERRRVNYSPRQIEVTLR